MSSSSDNPDALARLLTLAGRLKRLRRQGWVDREVAGPESVADHSWRLALMTLLLGSRSPEIDLERALTLALVHDLPEALAGDVTPFDDRLSESGADRESLFHAMPEYSDAAERAKTRAEREALHEMTAELSEDLALTLRSAWEEYEAGATPEARLVRQLDKLETWLQAQEYHQEQPEVVIESFRRGTDRDLDLHELQRLRRAIDHIFGQP